MAAIVEEGIDDEIQQRNVLEPLTNLKTSDISLVVEDEIAGKRISTTPLLTAIDNKKQTLVRLILMSDCSLSHRDQTEALKRAFRLLLSEDATEVETATEVFAGLCYPGRAKSPVFAPKDLHWLRNRLSGQTKNEISHSVRQMYAAWPDDRMLVIILLASSFKTRSGVVNFACDGWSTWPIQAMEELLLIGLKCHLLFEDNLDLGVDIPFGTLVLFLLKYLTIKKISMANVRRRFPSRPRKRVRKTLRRAHLVFHIAFFPWTRAEDNYRLTDYFPCCMKEDGICPHPLQDLCRAAFRRSLSSNNALIGVHQLPQLPKTLKDFLLLDDIYPCLKKVA